ncbi:MAG TPA: response regulator transcription factor [Solirubrobacteraceae bacterium]|nr:response regulator transcription factor [Solirubrobacteraceae bacterium]
MCDDEPQIVRALRVILREAGYEVSMAATLAEGLDLAAREPPDAAIIDVVLPDGSGIELCAELRSWSTMPIVVLSALDDEEQKVLALRAGADDYITKPFSARELLASLEAVFRRVVASDEEATVTVKGLEINFAAHTVLRDGREVKLTPIEFKLLSALARNRGRLMTSRALLSEVWGSAYANDAPLLRTHIANLRHKIEGPDAKAWLYIQTEAGVGYRFL